jgi:hypothetical protein
MCVGEDTIATTVDLSAKCHRRTHGLDVASDVEVLAKRASVT